MKLNVDSTVWQTNPFYRDPPYQLGENVKFKRLCENSMAFIADSCYQSLMFKHADDDVDQCFVDVVSDFYEIAGDWKSGNETDKFDLEIKTEGECWTVDGVCVVVVPVSSFGSALEECCQCNLHKHDVVLWSRNGHFVVNVVCDHLDLRYTAKSSSRHSFFKYLERNLGNLVDELKLNSDLDDLDLLELKTDFRELFEDLDSLVNVNKRSSICDKSYYDHMCLSPKIDMNEHLNVLISRSDLEGMCHIDSKIMNKFSSVHRRCSRKYVRGDVQVMKNVDHTSREIFDQGISEISEEPSKEQYSSTESNQELNFVELNEQLECSTESNKGLHNGESKEMYDNHQECLEPAFRLVEDGVDLDESSSFNSRVRLPVIQEESYDILAFAKKFHRGRTSSESSDVTEWRRDLWLSALDEPEPQWFSSTDTEGRVYFFEENSNTSSWTLPENHILTGKEKLIPDAEENETISSAHIAEKNQSRSQHEESTSLSNFSMHWPQLLGGTMFVIKEGALNKTKITENGKRVRKNWTSTYAVLTELLLLFFKDNKGFPSMMNGKGGPELSVDLNGAKIDAGDKVSSRKNVYMLSTVLGLQVLIQCDCATSAQQWLAAIQKIINKLPLGIENKGIRTKPESPLEENKPVPRIGRSKSMKLKNKSASIEDLSNVAEKQTKIRERLKKFFHRRPSVDVLVKKGIWKDEPVFGCLLEQVCPAEPPRVPMFVQHCVRCVERNLENMKTDGLYRVSGNISQVQKIRYQVDQNIYSLLDQEEDVHVLSGTLKLFFRELKQPLIPFKFFDKALRASTNSNYNEKIKEFREIVKSLPTCNHDTLKYLLQHLLRVTKYQEFNRMHIPNIAIVFGPTLMWPEQESKNMAFDLMQQNFVIDFLLSEFNNIFR